MARPDGNGTQWRVARAGGLCLVKSLYVQFSGRKVSVKILEPVAQAFPPPKSSKCFLNLAESAGETRESDFLIQRNGRAFKVAGAG